MIYIKHFEIYYSGEIITKDIILYVEILKVEKLQIIATEYPEVRVY
jgi:hypothetical protein